MQDNSNNIVWQYLESGDWSNAVKEARKLVKLDPQNTENTNLLKYIGKIDDIAYLVVHGNEQEKAKSRNRLEDIAAAMPRLAGLRSFKDLLESTKAFAVPVTEEKSVESSVTKYPLLETAYGKLKTKPAFKSLTRSPVLTAVNKPSGKMGTVITILVACIIVLLVNLISYVFLENQSRGAKNGVTYVIRSWLGLNALQTPINTLLLGDSACDQDLAAGQIADRLGGEVINLGNNVGASFLSDAWMLKEYIERFGAPDNVILLRCTASFRVGHSIEYMSSTPLPWGYWDRYGLAPIWKQGEITDLFLKKYFVLYYGSDILRDSLIQPWEISSNMISIPQPSQNYNRGNASGEQIEMSISKRLPTDYFGKFQVVPDNENALRFMSDLARSEHFQLYFIFQPEWDEAINAGLRKTQISSEIEYLTQFIDPEYVHFIRDDAFVFSKGLLQSPQHLRPEAAHIYTESIIANIIIIQNQLTAQQTISLKLDSATADKSSYKIGDKPAITVKVSTQDGSGLTDFKGDISCLLKPAGSSDGEWVVRASSVPLILGKNGTQEIVLKLKTGKIVDTGIYDLVVFLRQDVGNLSNETRVVLNNLVIVDNN